MEIYEEYDVYKILKTGDIEKLEEIYEKYEAEELIKRLEDDKICNETLEWMKSKGMDINYQCESMFLTAGRWHNVQAIKILLDVGVDMYCNDITGTALYKALLFGDCSAFPKNEQIVRAFLEHGYEISDKEREAFIRSAEDYEFHYEDFQSKSWYMNKKDEIESSYNVLFELLGVERIPRYEKHDGVSKIKIPEGSVAEQFEVMYNTMVPGHGKAKSMQGEAIRIIGTVNVGLSSGRENLNVDEKRMLKALLEFVGQGNPLSDEEIERVKNLRISRLNDEKMLELAGLTIKWISMNRNPFPLPEVNYKK